MCMLYIDNALSMRALQEMMSSDSELVSFSYLRVRSVDIVSLSTEDDKPYR